MYQLCNFYFNIFGIILLNFLHDASCSKAQELKILGTVVHMMDQLLSVYEEIVVQATPSHFLETEACTLVYGLHFLPFSEQLLQFDHADKVNTS
jgi:hypothetical protein